MHTRSLSPTKRNLVLTAFLVAFAMLAAACGGSSTDSSSEKKTDTSAATSDDATATAAVEKLEKLRIYHPETLAFAAPFTVLKDNGGLGVISDNVSIDTWSTPDILRSLITAGETDATAVPTYVGANLYNKGMDVKMAAVLVWGLLYVIGPEGTPAQWDSLRGQTVMVPFQNDMPDLVFRFLAEKNGLKAGEDFKIEYYAAPPEVVSRLASGKGQWAVLPEHVATAVLNQAKTNNIAIDRVLNLQDEWATATGLEPRIPQAGVVVSKQISSKPGTLGAFLDALEVAVAQVNTADEATVALLSESSGLPVPIVSSVIPRLNLEVVPGADAREELERFYTELMTFNPDIVGGKLPDDGFYLADPR